MKLKLWVRITLFIILASINVFIYTLLGYSSEWYEILGWTIVGLNCMLMYILFDDYNY